MYSPPTEQPIIIDAEGFLQTPSSWTPSMAEMMAARHGLPVLSDHHWRIITCVREEAMRCGETPALERICELCRCSCDEFHRLFPGDPARAVARISGLSRPGELYRSDRL